MPRIKNPKKKTKKATALKIASKPKSQKNTLAYYECLKCQHKGKKISQTAHECKTNALAINAKFSAKETKAVKKVSEAYKQMGVGLAEFIKAKKAK